MAKSSSPESAAAPNSDLDPMAPVGGAKQATKTPQHVPEFITNSAGARLPNPAYIATAKESRGRYDRNKIYEFVYIGPTDYLIPDIELTKVEINGKMVERWVETGNDLGLKPGTAVDYLGWIANTENGDFIERDKSAITSSWPYPWSEEAIIERFKRVPPELFEEFCGGYFELFEDRRPKVQKFYFETSRQHRKTIEAAQNSVFGG